MIVTPDDILRIITCIISVAVLFQTGELWALRHAAANTGVWSWPILRDDFSVYPSPLRRLIDYLLCYRGFITLLVMRFASALWLLWMPHAAPAVIMLTTTVLIALRWRGSFNGGSDFMTIVVLTALVAATLFPTHPQVTIGALWYIAIQSCNSYVLAGLAKLRTPNWRRGHALTGILQHTMYGRAPGLRFLCQWPWLACAAAWSVIIVECAFPLALFDPRWCVMLTAWALCFHISNAYILGLNRFVPAWLATYPALFWCSTQMWSP